MVLKLKINMNWIPSQAEDDNLMRMTYLIVEAMGVEPMFSWKDIALHPVFTVRGLKQVFESLLPNGFQKGFSLEFLLFEKYVIK